MSHLTSNMHFESTTDLSILHSNLNRSISSRESVVLIMTGAMNPVHRSHISNMIKTKHFLEHVHHFNVIGGYLSPSHNRYVQDKLGNDYINSEHRIIMCQKAIEEEDQQHWLSVDKAECLAPRFKTPGKVTNSLYKFINKKLNLPNAVRVIYVIGLDSFNRYKGMRSLRTPQGGIAVVYRSGQDKQLITSTTIRNNPNVFYVSAKEEHVETSSTESNDISSTLIRQKLKDKEACEHLTYSSVLDYLKTIPLEDQ